MNDKPIKISPHESSIIKIKNAFAITTKILYVQNELNITLHDSREYIKRRLLEKLIKKYLIKNFWFFLSDILVIAQNQTTSKTVLDLNFWKEFIMNLNIHHESHSFTMSWDEYDGCIISPEKLKKDFWQLDQSKLKKIFFNPPIDEEFRINLLKNINSSILGSVLSHFDQTSIGKVFNYKLNQPF